MNGKNEVEEWMNFSDHVNLPNKKAPRDEDDATTSSTKAVAGPGAQPCDNPQLVSNESPPPTSEAKVSLRIHQFEEAGEAIEKPPSVRHSSTGSIDEEKRKYLRVLRKEGDPGYIPVLLTHVSVDFLW